MGRLLRNAKERQNYHVSAVAMEDRQSSKSGRGRILPSQQLPRHVAEQLADIARVPAQEREPFCDSVCDSVQTVLKRDRSAQLLSEPGEALKKAAHAART